MQDRRLDQWSDDQRKGRMQDRQVPSMPNLNQPLNEVVKYIKDCNMARELELSTNMGDRTKYCAFHRVKGYDITECNSLRNVIEELS